jgi:APA family basic amino acid/polyamine antiporter
MRTLLVVMVLLCVLVLRRMNPTANRPFKTPGMPYVPILGALICLAQMFGLPLTTWIRLVVWLVVGFAIYFLYGRKAAERLRSAAVMRKAA